MGCSKAADAEIRAEQQRTGSFSRGVVASGRCCPAIATRVSIRGPRARPWPETTGGGRRPDRVVGSARGLSREARSGRVFPTSRRGLRARSSSDSMISAAISTRRTMRSYAALRAAVVAVGGAGRLLANRRGADRVPVRDRRRDRAFPGSRRASPGSAATNRAWTGPAPSAPHSSDTPRWRAPSRFGE
jgi:hypothetical protein